MVYVIALKNTSFYHNFVIILFVIIRIFNTEWHCYPTNFLIYSLYSQFRLNPIRYKQVWLYYKTVKDFQDVNNFLKDYLFKKLIFFLFLAWWLFLLINFYQYRQFIEYYDLCSGEIFGSKYIVPCNPVRYLNIIYSNWQKAEPKGYKLLNLDSNSSRLWPYGDPIYRFTK
jgi:hypothetical protein